MNIHTQLSIGTLQQMQREAEQAIAHGNAIMALIRHQEHLKVQMNSLESNIKAYSNDLSAAGMRIKQLEHDIDVQDKKIVNLQQTIVAKNQEISLLKEPVPPENGKVKPDATII